MELQPEDTILDFLAQTICSVPINELDSDTKRLLNIIAILYMEHGLTSASYAARICISEEGSVYSALINAIATHKSCTPMFAWQHFDDLFNASDADKRSFIKTYSEERRLPKPFRDFVHPCKDPRTDILMDHCDAAMLEEVMEIQKGFDGRCHLRFDVFVFHLLRRLHKNQNQSTINAVRSMLMMPRIVGWLSHIAEQHKVKRRIEHIAAYVGPAPKHITRKTNA
ncbi:citrate synthase [Babesia ovata]|uniref:Citrate synthase n=1 Tax=Babesia ovata TaxID=189622 RepID=A0A2H6K8R4_9APIC|nr:citrate synthase [Babesia ovata]GBE59339.1 citrate synthase [Babesia ovata]